MWSAMTFRLGLSASQSPPPAASTAPLAAASRCHEDVDLVVAVHVLQHRGQALQAHAGVDAGFGSLCITPSSVRLNCMKTLFQISM